MDPSIPPSDTPTEKPAQTRKSGGGIGTAAFKNFKRMSELDAERDAATNETMFSVIKMLGATIAGLILIIVVLVAGVLGSNVSVPIPGLGDVEIVQPKD